MESPPTLPPAPSSDLFLNVNSSFPRSTFSSDMNGNSNHHTPPIDGGLNTQTPTTPFSTAAPTSTASEATSLHNLELSTGPSGELPPPPPAIVAPVLIPPSPAVAPRRRSTSPRNRSRSPSRSRSRSRSSERSGSESGDSEDEERDHPRDRWHPIDEDKSEPCADEVAYIDSRPERSALDYGYWESKAFFDTKDPDIVPQESGRIDWLVEHFNGTKESPNNDIIMRSPIVRIGGYEWRIKFYPRGDDTHFLSVYLENVTMQDKDCEEFEEFESPAFPALTDVKVPNMRKRHSVAAQLAIVMYNPAEPRTYKEEMDAHQFNKSKADYGWKYFTPRHDFHYRQHGERKAILRDDKLAFTAYIRIVRDPTGCMWQHETESAYDNSIMTTSLRPFAWQLPHIAAIVPLLHFGPFREFLKACQSSSKTVQSLQSFLYSKLYRRECSPQYGQLLNTEPADAIAYLRQTARQLQKECDPAIVIELLGTFDVEHGAAIGHNRLNTVKCTSVQAAIDQHPDSIATPKLLTLELQRHDFSPQSRRWTKITNKVEMNRSITVSGTTYHLFAFVTHCGDLYSNKHNVYINPGGEGELWYAYTHRRVTAMTIKQAVDGHCGFDEAETTKKHKRRDSPFSGVQDPSEDEVAYAVMYVREDVAASTFSRPTQESWENVPSSTKEGISITDQSKAQDEDRTTEESTMSMRAEAQISERERQRSQDSVADSSATPEWPLMDGEDVIMSDADGEEDSPRQTSDMDASGLFIRTPEISSAHMHTTTIDTLGRDFYKGQMCGNQYHGKGHLITLSGDQYVGSFRNGKKDGYGKMIYASTGNIYEGEWKNGQHHGQGKLTEASTGNVFEGGWQDGKKHGDFILRGKVTEEDRGCCTICYVNTMNTAFYDCGHVVACRECAGKVDNCPICRKRVLARLELFGVKMSLE